MNRFITLVLSLVLIGLISACSPPEGEPDAAFEVEATSPIQNEVEPTYVEEETQDTTSTEADPLEEVLEEDMTAEEIADMEPIPPTADPAEVNVEEEAPAEDAAPAEAAAEGSLAGTTWDVDGIVVEFQDEDTVFLKGGAIAQFSPSGLEAQYTLTPNEEGGADLEADVLGTPVTGTWDGEVLVINGTPATAQ